MMSPCKSDHSLHLGLLQFVLDKRLPSPLCSVGSGAITPVGTQCRVLTSFPYVGAVRMWLHQHLLRVNRRRDDDCGGTVQRNPLWPKCFQADSAGEQHTWRLKPQIAT